MNRARWLIPAGCLLLSLQLVPGCAEPIRTYEVPVSGQRTLAAIIELETANWFVKLMGRSDDIAEQKANFEKFVKSLRFPRDGKEPVTWTVPEGWVHEAGSDLRYATFRLPKRLEVTVFKFGPQPEQRLDNINRWRGQLNLKPISARELQRTAQREKLDGGIEALLVDMQSARYAPLPSEEPDLKNLFEYDIPAGWVRESDPGRFAMAAFSVQEADRTARVTITFAGGSLVANVNRWREEVGLPEINEDQIRREARTTRVDRFDGYMVELNGPRGRSTMGIICPVKEAFLFVKMMGDADLVARQKTAFEQFAASLSLRGGN